MKTMWIAMLVSVLLTLCGCRGGLFGGKMSPDMAKGDIKVYEIHFASGANSIANIGNAGTQSPMYQTPEGMIEGGATGDGGTGTYVTTPAMPANGSQNAGTAAGKYVMQTINDGTKRSAESDIAAAAQLLAGNTQTQGTQTPAQVQRQGTASATGTATQTPTATKTTTIAPATALTGAGDANMPNPTAVAAGPGSAPIVTPTATSTTTPAAVAPETTGQRNYDVVATGATISEGIMTATWANGSATGTPIGPLRATDGAPGSVYVLSTPGAEPVTVLLPPAVVAACPGCSEP